MVNLLHEIIDESVHKFPYKPAVSYGNDMITYKKLNERSNKLANLLLDLGVSKGDRIGLFINKRVEAIVAILGILKSGAAFVPLNVENNIEDLKFIINDCKIEILIGDENVNKFLKSERKINSLDTIIYTEEDQLSNKQHYSIHHFKNKSDWYSSHPPNIKIIGNDLAYIFYTSGSTGTPKGVMIAHSSIVFVIKYRRDFLNFDSETTVVSLCPLHFDPVLNEIFCTLSTGGKLILVNDRNSIVLYRNFLQTIKNDQVDTFFCVPSFLNMLTSNLMKIKSDLQSINQIVFGAGSCPVKIIQNLQEALSETDFVHGYGLTEAAVTASSYRISDPFNVEYEAFPIGSPIPNSEFYVLDENNSQVEEGVGELVIRGPHLMKGYWNNKEKTGQVLKQNPIHSQQNEKVLFTGDLVRVESNGDLIFVGRKDEQIKSAGHRIELGEIEMFINKCKGVKEVCAIPIPDQQLDNKIKCVLTLKNNQELEAIKEYCKKNLMAYKIPHMWEVWEDLPKNQSGKMDKKLIKKKAIANS